MWPPNESSAATVSAMSRSVATSVSCETGTAFNPIPSSLRGGRTPSRVRNHHTTQELPAGVEDDHPAIARQATLDREVQPELVRYLLHDLDPGGVSSVRVQGQAVLGCRAHPDADQVDGEPRPQAAVVGIHQAGLDLRL